MPVPTPFAFSSFSIRRWDKPLHLQLNPDVSVREVGVMEKCTFCVPRITSAKRQANAEERPLRDGDVTPACAQACPTGAVVFGDLNAPRESSGAVVALATRHEAARGTRESPTEGHVSVPAD